MSLNKKELQDLFDNSFSLADFGNKVGTILNREMSYKNIHKFLDDYDIDTTSMRTCDNVKNGKNANYGMINMDKFTKVHYGEKRPSNETIRKNLISLRGLRCENCGLEIWNSQPIPIQVHHIDGDRYNNCIDNLQLLCPNCHAQTDNYCTKSKTKVKTKRVTDEELLEALKQSYSVRQAVMSLGLTDGVGRLYQRCYKLMNENGVFLKEKEKIEYTCSKCGKRVDKNTRLCQSCRNEELFHKTYTSRGLTKEILEDKIKNKSFSEIGREYAVSANTVKKWLKHFCLPNTKKDIQAYFDK